MYPEKGDLAYVVHYCCNGMFNTLGGRIIKVTGVEANGVRFCDICSRKYTGSFIAYGNDDHYPRAWTRKLKDLDEPAEKYTERTKDEPAGLPTHMG